MSRVNRIRAAIVALILAAGLGGAWAATNVTSAPAVMRLACHAPDMPAGSTIAVDDATGDASAPATGAPGTASYVCVAGMWAGTLPPAGTDGQ